MKTVAKIVGMIDASRHHGIVNCPFHSVELARAFNEGYWIVLRRM